MYYRCHCRDSFVIQVAAESETLPHQETTTTTSTTTSSNRLNFSAMKIFNRFRKIMMRLIFSFPSGGGSGSTKSSSMAGNSKHKTCERYDPPKTSCSSYYSSQSHYSEAIADCIEFFNKSSSSSMEENFEGRRSSDMLV